MKILSLDLATKTGWALNTRGTHSGVTEFALKRGESPGMRFLRCRAWLNEVLNLLGGHVDVIVYEQAHHRGGAPSMENIDTSADRAKLIATAKTGARGNAETENFARLQTAMALY